MTRPDITLPCNGSLLIIAGEMFDRDWRAGFVHNYRQVPHHNTVLPLLPVYQHRANVKRRLPEKPTPDYLRRCGCLPPPRNSHRRSIGQNYWKRWGFPPNANTIPLNLISLASNVTVTCNEGSSAYPPENREPNIKQHQRRAISEATKARASVPTTPRG